MDLELMFPSIISLRTANLKKWTKLFTNLLALVLAYSILILTSVTYIPLCISFVLREHYFSYISVLHHHAHTISLTSLQLHHHTFLIKLTSLQLHHLTFLIKFTSITLLHHYYFPCTKLIISPNSITLYTLIIALYHSRILSISPMTIHLQIPSDANFSHSVLTFVSSFCKYFLTSVWNNIWDPSKLLLLCGDVETIPGLQPIDKSLVFCSICSSEINQGVEQDTAITCSDHNCNAQCQQLQKADKTPFIDGCATVQKDRNNIHRGGLLLVIWTRITFEKLLSFEQAGMEILSICLRKTKSTWIEHCNVYLPSTSTQHNSFNPSLIKQGPSSLILVDLNDHSQMWDLLQSQDQRDNEILESILDNDQHILTDGSATWTSQIAGNDSTSDISLCGCNWSAKTSSILEAPIGSSDHLPILVEINHKICY